ncbi:uroporphyrinogen-III synthase [Geoglobus sp.]
MRVAVFRPADYAKETVELFQKEGFDVLHVPMIGIVEEAAEVEDADFTIVTSQTSARIAVEKNLLRGWVIAIGPKTAEVMVNSGFDVLMPSRYDSKTLFHEFRSMLAGSRVNLLRSDKGDPVLLKLSEVCDLREYVLYRIVPAYGERQRNAVREIVEGQVDAVVFSSRMIVKAFMENARAEGIKDEAVGRLNEIVTVAIGPPSADELSKFGVSAVTPVKYTFDGVLELLKKLRRT